jgi:hypothetical protein
LLKFCDLAQRENTGVVLFQLVLLFHNHKTNFYGV